MTLLTSSFSTSIQQILKAGDKERHGLCGFPCIDADEVLFKNSLFN